LIDSWASAEIARKLLNLQRQRLSYTQVIDQRARRVLHDDVLQDLHATVLKLAGGGEEAIPEVDEAITMLTATHREISRLLRNMPGTALPDIGDLGLIGSLEALVTDEFSARFEKIIWDVGAEGKSIEANLSQLEKEVLYYAAREAMRNSARHGRDGDEARDLTLMISVRGENRFELVIEDDGVGLGERNGNDQVGGQGLSLHSTMMAVVGGELRVESEHGKFTRVVLSLPGY
jgi:signal transduction histidine kinase